MEKVDAADKKGLDGQSFWSTVEKASNQGNKWDEGSYTVMQTVGSWENWNNK